MTRDETKQLLRVRSALTSQPYGDDTIEAWHDVLEPWRYDDCRAALGVVARDTTTITPAHLLQRLGGHRPPPAVPLPHPSEAQRARNIERLAEIAEHVREHTQTHDESCRFCRQREEHATHTKSTNGCPLCHREMVTP